MRQFEEKSMRKLAVREEIIYDCVKCQRFISFPIPQERMKALNELMINVDLSLQV